MDITIIYRSAAVGTLQIEQQGLYYICKAACKVSLTEPLHLYAVNGCSARSLGVLAKDGSLCRKLSKHSMPQLPEQGIIGKADGDFLPWCGAINDERIADAYIKQDGAQMLLALPIVDGGEVPLVAYAAQMQPQTVCGRQCLVLPLQDGKPLPLPQEDIQTEETDASNALLPSETEMQPYSYL